MAIYTGEWTFPRRSAGVAALLATVLLSFTPALARAEEPPYTFDSNGKVLGAGHVATGGWGSESFAGTAIGTINCRLRFEEQGGTYPTPPATTTSESRGRRLVHQLLRRNNRVARVCHG